MFFAKSHSLGNDFLLVEEAALAGGVDRGLLARRLCDRNRGLGADGMVVFQAAHDSASMRVYNRDGSEAEMSGNGLRCLGAYLLFSSRVKGPRLTVETASGPRYLERIAADGVRSVLRADMGFPRLSSRDIPIELLPPRDRVVNLPLEVAGHEIEITALSMGNPHCVLFVERRDAQTLHHLGPRIENHILFPRRTNVELVEVLGREEIAVSFWERGVGETEASGTGASAAAVAAMLNGRVSERVKVFCPGGSVEVEWRDGREVYLTGEAVIVATGEFLGRVTT
jgi:diaminopimelate epimerase